MKRKLVVGLGNPLVPGDAAGVRCFERLRSSCDANADVEFLAGGTDLLRVAPYLRDRDLIVLVDAVEHAGRALTVLEHGAPELCDLQQHAHHLSAVQALELIRWTDENVRKARCVWVLAC